MITARSTRLFLLSALSFPVFFLCGCGTSAGGGGSQSPTGALTGSTSVSLLASSIANDRLQQFNIGFTSLVLTSQSGKTVTLSAQPNEFPEFIHLNGTAEPLLTATVPQDIYTSATANLGGAQFTCVEIDSTNSLHTSTYSYGQVPAAQISVTLPSPITITGAAMALNLDLLVSQSATYPSCTPSGIAQYSINPTFSLTPVTFAAQPTSAANGKLTGLIGIVTTLSGTTSAGTGVTITSSDGPVWSASLPASAALQGITGVSALASGMAINFDAAFQADGSLTISRLAAPDSNPANVSVVSGPLEFFSDVVPAIVMNGTEQQGLIFENMFLDGGQDWSNASATYQVSPQPANLRSLPFTPSFTAANAVPGQRISLTSHAASMNGPGYAPISTLTLIPQTIDGTITAVSSSGAFEVYTVTLSPHDLFPNLAVQGGQASLLTNPSSVVIYSDQSTQLLNTTPLTTGSVLRFNGLVFNDNGTLRMDCAQINDGVAP